MKLILKCFYRTVYCATNIIAPYIQVIGKRRYLKLFNSKMNLMV